MVRSRHRRISTKIHLHREAGSLGKNGDPRRRNPTDGLIRRVFDRGAPFLELGARTQIRLPQFSYQLGPLFQEPDSAGPGALWSVRAGRRERRDGPGLLMLCGNGGMQKGEWCKNVGGKFKMNEAIARNPKFGPFVRIRAPGRSPGVRPYQRPARAGCPLDGPRRLILADWHAGSILRPTWRR